LWKRGIRYRLHPKLPGRPDFVIVFARVAIFVDGCFWHSCPDHGSTPTTNREFWVKKLAGNVVRDRRVDAELASAGWRVARIWEHSVETDLAASVREILKLIGKSRLSVGREKCRAH
jgi:DNA mismatch endonuclease (patch repair protein)